MPGVRGALELSPPQTTPREHRWTMDHHPVAVSAGGAARHVATTGWAAGIQAQSHAGYPQSRHLEPG